MMTLPPKTGVAMFRVRYFSEAREKAPCAPEILFNPRGIHGGGALGIRFLPGYDTIMKGPVVRVCSGNIGREVFE
jgi:hypothetical protein